MFGLSRTGVMPPGRSAKKTSTDRDQVNRADRDHQRETILRQWEEDEAKLQEAIANINISAARATCSRLEAELADARHTLFQMAQQETQAHQLFDRQRGDHERALLALVDPRITAFLRELDELRDGLSRKIQRYVGLSQPDINGKRRETHSTNLDAVRRVSACIGAARERVEALRFERVSDVQATIEQVRRSIPTVDEAEAQLEREAELLPPSA